MKIAFLGTSGAFPTATRNATSHVVRVQGETVLLDCGEGTQQQLRRSSHHFQVDRIFLSHMHLDHTLGLPGYVWTQAIMHRTSPLTLYTPVGTRDYVARFIGDVERLPFPFVIVEVDGGAEIQCVGYGVTVARVEHHGGVCLGFRVEEHARPGKVDVEKARQLGIQPGPQLGQLVRGEPVRVGDRLIHPAEVVGPPRPGRSVTYSGDTRPCEALTALARGSDLLIHEAMFLRALGEEAVNRGHSTSTEAAQVAAAAGVRLVALTHISHRHQDAEGMGQLLQEAQEHFPDCFIPADLDTLELSLHG